MRHLQEMQLDLDSMRNERIDHAAIAESIPLEQHVSTEVDVLTNPFYGMRLHCHAQTIRTRELLSPIRVVAKDNQLITLRLMVRNPLGFAKFPLTSLEQF